MKLIARNLGPIHYADLDFNDKIIIIGPNSSGKTFLSTVFYILYGPINVLPFIPKEVNIKLEEGITDLELNLKDFEDDLSEYYKKVIELTFSNPKNLITFGEDKCVIENDVLSLTIGSDDNADVKVKESPINIKIEYKKTQGPLAVISRTNDRLFVIGDEENAKRLLISAVLELFYEKYNPIAFVSTERISVLGMNNLISNYVYSPIVASQNKPLILDFMRWLYPIEEKFYGVKFTIDNGRLSAEIKGKKVPLSVISTGVGQLGVIEMLVENPVLKTLIIEEPEINLHTDMQIEIGKYLSKINNKNMFITTHSEWFTVAFAYYFRDVKVYELRKKDNDLFESKEIKVNEDGTLESLETIHKPEEEFLNRMISEILSKNDK